MFIYLFVKYLDSFFTSPRQTNPNELNRGMFLDCAHVSNTSACTGGRGRDGGHAGSMFAFWKHVRISETCSHSKKHEYCVIEYYIISYHIFDFPKRSFYFNVIFYYIYNFHNSYFMFFVYFIYDVYFVYFVFFRFVYYLDSFFTSPRRTNPSKLNRGMFPECEHISSTSAGTEGRSSRY